LSEVAGRDNRFMVYASTLAVVAGLCHALAYAWPFEDLYITLRYARNLIEGIGLRFNPGETVDGFTSIGWVMVTAALGALGAAMDTAAQLASLACGLALVAWAVVAARRWSGEPAAIAAAAGLFVAANGTFAYYAMSGMETTAFALAVLGAIACLRGDGPRAAIASGGVLAAAALLRPEGMGYTAVLLAALAFDRTGRRQVPLVAASFLALFGPYFVWHWVHFGHPLPNTYYAKASVSGGLIVNGVEYVEAYLTTHLGWLVLAAAALTLARRFAERWVRLCAAAVLAAGTNAVVVGGDTFPFFRFLLPAMAPAGILAAVALGDLLRWLRSRTRAAPVLAGVATCALLVWTAGAALVPRVAILSSKPGSLRQATVTARTLNEDYFLVGAWLRETFPPDTLVAVNAAGIVPYVSRRPALDMLGLNDAHIAHAPIPLGRGAHGHEKHDVDYVLSRRPDIIIPGLPKTLHRPLASGAELEHWFARWFPYLPGDRELFYHPDFRRDYRPLSAPVAPGRWLTLFVHRDLSLPE
jgi:arabinofuranosyltransferase